LGPAEVTRRLVFRPQAERELSAATDIYRDENPAAAVEFAETVQLAIATIERNPFLYQAIEGNIRRAVLRRFPYIIVYLVTETEIVDIACAHTSRNPTYWRDRLR
jgi:plasmid stabilization system protein ParE